MALRENYLWSFGEIKQEAEKQNEESAYWGKSPRSVSFKSLEISKGVKLGDHWIIRKNMDSELVIAF